MSGLAKTSLSTHFARYATSNLLVLVAGFVSFPITTRALSSEQFGILSYWESALLLVIAVVKLGSSDGAIRFFPHDRAQEKLGSYATNFVAAPALVGGIIWLIAMLLIAIAGHFGLIAAPMVAALTIAQGILVAWSTLGLRVMQAQELSGLSAVLTVTWRWVLLAATVVILLGTNYGIVGLAAARLTVSALLTGIIVFWFAANLKSSIYYFKKSESIEALRYGFPLALREISGISLMYVDRFMMSALVGNFHAIGVYSIGFALASYIDQLISTALSQALAPVITRVYETEGASAVQQIKQKVLRPLIYFSGAATTGLLLIGPDFVRLIASADKSDSAPIFQIIGIGFLIRSIISTCAEGLLLERRTKTVLAITIISAAFNVALNYYVIPDFGISGAACSTTLSLIFQQVLLYAYCPRGLRTLPQTSTLVRTAIASTLCLLLARAFVATGYFNYWMEALCSLLLIILIFGAAILLDKQILSSLKLIRNSMGRG